MEGQILKDIREIGKEAINTRYGPFKLVKLQGELEETFSIPIPKVLIPQQSSTWLLKNNGLNEQGILQQVQRYYSVTPILEEIIKEQIGEAKVFDWIDGGEMLIELEDRFRIQNIPWEVLINGAIKLIKEPTCYNPCCRGCENAGIFELGEDPSTLVNYLQKNHPGMRKYIE